MSEEPSTAGVLTLIAAGGLAVVVLGTFRATWTTVTLAVAKLTQLTLIRVYRAFAVGRREVSGTRGFSGVAP